MSADTRPATPLETDRWWRDYQERMRRWYGNLGAPAFAERRLGGWSEAEHRSLGIVLEDAEPVGHVAVARHIGQGRPVSTIHDVWVAPRLRRRGLGRAARGYAERWSRPWAASMAVDVWTDDPGVSVLFADYPLRNQRMIKRLATPPPPTPPGVTARPLTDAEYPEWLADEAIGYVADMVRSGSLPEAEATAKAERDYAELLPRRLATPGNTWSILEVDGEIVAQIWLGENSGLAFVYSVSVRPRYRGRGYGRVAMQVGEAHAFAAGKDHLALNVFGHNEVAINLYRSLGYAVVEQSRAVDLT